jgi:hypothetical protein
MNNVKIFIKTYWQHARSALDLVFFIMSIIGLLFCAQINLPIQVAIILVCIVAIVAAYRTWLYQYQQTTLLINSKEKEPKFEDLNSLQKAILTGMSSEQQKEIITTRTMGGAIVLGIGDINDDYDGNEIIAELEELEKIGILRIDRYSEKSSRPIYAPTSLGFKILNQIKSAEDTQ